MTRSVWVSFSCERKWIVINSSRENWKVFKKLPLLCKTRVFRDWGKSPESRQFHPPKHFKPEVLKNLLSVFRNWKSHLRGSRELSCKNLCVPLATEPSTHEQVAKTDPRAYDCGMRLGWPAIESLKQGNIVFEIFNFCTIKILSKK